MNSKCFSVYKEEFISHMLGHSISNILFTFLFLLKEWEYMEEGNYLKSSEDESFYRSRFYSLSEKLEKTKKLLSFSNKYIVSTCIIVSHRIDEIVVNLSVQLIPNR